MTVWRFDSAEEAVQQAYAASSEAKRMIEARSGKKLRETVAKNTRARRMKSIASFVMVIGFFLTSTYLGVFIFLSIKTIAGEGLAENAVALGGIFGALFFLSGTMMGKLPVWLDGKSDS